VIIFRVSPIFGRAIVREQGLFFALVHWELAEAWDAIEFSFLKIRSNSVAHMLAFTPEAIGWISAAIVGLLFLGMVGRLAAALSR